MGLGWVILKHFKMIHGETWASPLKWRKEDGRWIITKKEGENWKILCTLAVYKCSSRPF